MPANAKEDSRKVVSKAEEPRYLLQLEPPIGTSFWSVQDIPIFNYKNIGNISDVQYLLVSWSCQCYIFTTNQKPDADNFGGSTKDGDNWTATIDYEQAMQMFNNTGNDTFTHVAKYNETYQLLKMNQSGGVMDNTAEAVFQPDAGSAWYNTPKEIHGLSVFRQTEPSQWPLKFTFKAIAEFDST
ncbi:hypothetical protein AB1N83_012676, partial [Pleurotus pulmonarius]